MKTIVGIDPGAGGAIAMIDSLSVPVGALNISVADFNQLDYEEIIKWLLWDKDLYVCIEKAQVMPRKRRGPTGEEEVIGQGAVGMFRYGVHYGTYLGIFKALKIPFQEVHPITWKKEFSLLKQPKERSIQVAQQLFPQMANQLTRKKDHGRAEALLIAEYGRRHFGSEFLKVVDPKVADTPVLPRGPYDLLLP